MSQDLPIGTHEGLPEADYHVRELGVASKSALDLVHRSPAHYKAWVDGTIEEEDRLAFKRGTALHCAVLEPEKYARVYTAHPDFGDCRKKENKAARNEWREANKARIWLPVDMLESVNGMSRAVLAHPLASKLFVGGKSEVTLRWQDETTGLQCKARVDYLSGNGATAIDLKSTANADYDAFKRSVSTYGYHRQAAFYSEGLRALEKPVSYFLFVAVESAAPYGVATYSLNAEALAKGLSSIRDDLETLATCVKTNEWPGYPVRLQELDLPPWAA